MSRPNLRITTGLNNHTHDGPKTRAITPEDRDLVLAWLQEHDPARRLLNLTSPETKRRAVLALAAHWSDDMSVEGPGDVFVDAEEAVAVVLRSVEEGEQ